MGLYLYKAKVIRIIDGDTFDSMIDLGFKIFLKQRVRLWGIDSPETRTRDIKEKESGLKAKERLQEMIEEKEINLKSVEWGKYGRCLAVIWVDGFGDSVNDVLVKEGHAVYKEY